MGVFAYGCDETDATECRSLNVPFSETVMLGPVSDCFSSEMILNINTDPISGARSPLCIDSKPGSNPYVFRTKFYGRR